MHYISTPFFNFYFSSEDVLTDIDFMLQGLTDELDAMLEEEVLNNG
jgi:hypothetical protein